MIYGHTCYAPKRTKPRIRFEFGLWNCSGMGWYIGFGSTPKEAYEDWVAHQ